MSDLAKLVVPIRQLTSTICSLRHAAEASSIAWKRFITCCMSVDDVIRLAMVIWPIKTDYLSQVTSDGTRLPDDLTTPDQMNIYQLSIREPH